ncbi:MAG: OmpA family protein [Bacteroidetes bacterium]|nr:OmpA family protein [Bacteroidota bacterium]
MRSFFLILSVCLYTTNVFSQQKKSVDTTYEDSFDKLKLWAEWDDKDSKASIENGSYMIEHKRTSGSWAFWKSIDLDKNKDYSFEVEMEQIAGDQNYGHGIIWGLKDWENYNSFIISPSGYFQINKTESGKYSEIQEWKTTSLVKQGINVLRVSKRGAEIQFLLNGEVLLVVESKKMQLWGSYFGMIVYNQKKVSVPRIQLTASMPRINHIKDPVKGLIKENLGKNVNSAYSEICPIVSPDGKTLFFTRKNHPQNHSKTVNDDIWYAKKLNETTWSEAQNMGSPFNNSGHNMLVSVSADNNTLYLSNTYNPDGTQKGAGLSVAVRSADSWAMPKEIKINNYYNTHTYVNNCLSQDNAYLLHAIERKDSKGGADIYVSFLNKDGSYSEPLNLGADINTPGYETTPFLAADNKTLYFSSDMHPGYGNNDIFVTTRLDDTWKKWSTPLNLGPEINSVNWDAYFTIPASGDVAYMVSSENSLGEGDIVKVKLPEAAKPLPVVLIKGKVLNKKTNLPLKALISYYDVVSQEKVGEAISNPASGEYNIILQYGKKYSFRADKDGFYAVNDFLDVSSLDSYKEIEKDLYLVPVEIGQIVRLNNVFFDFNKSELKPDSYQELDRLVDFLKSNSGIEIEIGGHTDNIGNDEYNQRLSQQRVESVMLYLTSKGVQKDRLQAKGYGETKPIANNDTEDGKATNRRVEFTILKQ